MCAKKEMSKAELRKRSGLSSVPFTQQMKFTEVYSIEQSSIIRYEQKVSAVRSYPDSLRSQIELICILYITETIHSIECLREIMDASEFLQFFLAPNDFDYRQVDFSYYMWENIVRYERFMEFFLAHKSDIIPNLQKKVDADQATEFERKVLYGFLLDKNELL